MWSPRAPWRPAAALLVLLAGCRQDMYDQPRLEPLEGTELFADGLSARQPPKGTVARGAATEPAEKAFVSGLDDAGQLIDSPLAVDRPLLLRGRERYGIHCSPCHGLTGDGDGMIVLRGYKRPPSFHTDRLRSQKAGYFVDVLRNGFGTMPSYGHIVAPRDRWAIAAFVAALQLSQSASYSDLPPGDAARLEAAR